MACYLVNPKRVTKSTIVQMALSSSGQRRAEVLRLCVLKMIEPGSGEWPVRELLPEIREDIRALMKSNESRRVAARELKNWKLYFSEKESRAAKQRAEALELHRKATKNARQRSIEQQRAEMLVEHPDISAERLDDHHPSDVPSGLVSFEFARSARWLEVLLPTETA